MKFNSLQEYFYKVQAVLFLLILMPLFAFICLVVGPIGAYDGLNEYHATLTLILLSLLALLTYGVATYRFNKKVTQISRKVGLSVKLDEYYHATLVRYSTGAMSCLILVIGFFLTQHIVFTLLFALMLLLFLLAWPRPKKACIDLNLRGDEKEMVLYKKHTL